MLVKYVLLFLCMLLSVYSLYSYAFIIAVIPVLVAVIDYSYREYDQCVYVLLRLCVCVYVCVSVSVSLYDCLLDFLPVCLPAALPSALPACLPVFVYDVPLIYDRTEV